MPTIHNTNRKLLKKNNLQTLPWSIGDLSGLDRAASDNDSESCNSKQNRNNHIDDDTNNTNNTQSRKRPCKSPSVIPSNLKRISDEIIWVQEGKAQHPAYILQDCTNAQSNDILFMSSNTVWVEWVSNGKKESIYKDQIVQDGLQARKRHRPDYFTEDPSGDKSASATDAQNNKKKKKARSNSQRADREMPIPPLVATAKSSSSTSLNRDDSVSLNRDSSLFKKKSPRCKGKSILEGLDDDSITQKDNREKNHTTQSKESEMPQSHHGQLMENVDKKLKEADNLAKMQNIWHQSKPSQVVTTAKPLERPEPQFDAIQQEELPANNDNHPSEGQPRFTPQQSHTTHVSERPKFQFTQPPQPQFIQQRAVQQDWTVPKVNGSWRGDWDKEARKHIIASM